VAAEPATTDVALASFGDDLNVAIAKSVAALEQNDLDTFVLNMFPAGELRRPDAVQRRARIVARLTADPVPVTQMIADLKAVLGKTPTYEDSQQVAVFQLQGAVIEQKRLKFQLPDRIFKFRKVEGSWRLYDNTTETRKAVAVQSALKPPDLPPAGGVSARSVVFEKIGDAWRIAEFHDRD